jgi:hypothetical protein
MPGGCTTLLALLSGLGCSYALDFSGEAHADGNTSPTALTDAVPRPADGGADAAGPPDAALPPDAAPCVEGVAQVIGPTGTCYLVFDDPSTWDAAMAGCEALGPTAQLVTVASAEENALLAPLLGAAHRWIGLTDVGSEGTWRWYTGEHLLYTNWRAGEPNNGGGAENCGVIEGNTGALWDDRPCGLTYGRICER